MRYISTRGRAPALGFEATMLTGLAGDGGLYVPDAVPVLPRDAIAGLAGQPYEDVAFRVMRPFVDDALDDDALAGCIARAYAPFDHAARAPLRQLGPRHHLLELFHGPTLAFKDFAMQLIGQLFAQVLARRGERVTIVGATSGDTGSAAIEAFRGLDAVDVVILYPEGRVSEVQRRQMTTPEDDNVHAVAVAGDFDDCQAALKAMFADDAFRREVGLAAVNSINWARVLAQTVYYVTAATTLGAPHRPVAFSVPTGNFGDVFAGDVARRMGLPIETLIVATNQNDILHRTFATGRHDKAGVRPSISPSMDIQVSSNFERALFDAHGRDGAAVAALMAELTEAGGFALSPAAMAHLGAVYTSGRASEAETGAAIRRFHDAAGVLLCPHSAVGAHVAEGWLADHPGTTPVVTLATAHPAKFPDAVAAATGMHPPLPSRMSDLYVRPERGHRAPNDLGALMNLIREVRRR